MLHGLYESGMALALASNGFFLLLMSVVVRTLFLVDENDSDDHRDS